MIRVSAELPSMCRRLLHHKVSINYGRIPYVVDVRNTSQVQCAVCGKMELPIGDMVRPCAFFLLRGLLSLGAAFFLLAPAPLLTVSSFVFGSHVKRSSSSSAPLLGAALHMDANCVKEEVLQVLKVDNSEHLQAPDSDVQM